MSETIDYPIWSGKRKELLPVKGADWRVVKNANDCKDLFTWSREVSDCPSPAANKENRELFAFVQEIAKRTVVSSETRTRQADGIISKAISDLKSNSDFEVVVSRIVALADRSDEDYDDEFLPADLATVTAALLLIQNVGLRLGKAFPRALVGPNGNGGLSVEWRRDDNAVKLIASANDYQIFYLFDGEYGMEPATDSSLTKWLKKFGQ